jgi:adenylate cyclase class 2
MAGRRKREDEYVMQRDGSVVEEEVKIAVDDVPEMLAKIRSVAAYVRTEYLRDVIYGLPAEKKKIRLRIQDNFEYRAVEATHKYRLNVEGGVKREVEETVYKGNSCDEAVAAITSQGAFVEENSYEKTRVVFAGPRDTMLTLDIYPYGVWLEIEGNPAAIHAVAKQLGYTQKDYLTDSADDLYLAWIREHSLPEMWDVRFGLCGKR